MWDKFIASALCVLALCTVGCGSSTNFADVSVGGFVGLGGKSSVGGASSVGGLSFDGGLQGTGGYPACPVSIQLPPATMTKEAWDALAAPLTSEHNVLPLSCQGSPISQDFLVLPSAACSIAPNYNYVTYPVRLCTLQPTCSGPESCQDSAFGTCRGDPYSYCTYPSYPLRQIESCAVNSDCVTLPGGSCLPSESDVNCYPDGECIMAAPCRYCNYPEQPCALDTECTSAPGGQCSKFILFTRCVYSQCAVDADCGAGSRCACSEDDLQNHCIPADCSTDSDCGAGQVCRLELGCFGTVIAYHCSTSSDGCASDQDCAGMPCSFNGTTWQCRTGCPTLD